MSVEDSVKENYTDVKVRKGPINFRSYSFLRELVEIKQENNLLDKSRKIDYTKLFRRIEI
jgi:hypothetical protein